MIITLGLPVRWKHEARRSELHALAFGERLDEVAMKIRAALDAALLKAHAEEDGPTLARLYSEAADLSEAAGEHEAMCFYLTHAYVFALEAGSAEAEALHARLKAEGREE